MIKNIISRAEKMLNTFVVYPFQKKREKSLQKSKNFWKSCIIKGNSKQKENTSENIKSIVYGV